MARRRSTAPRSVDARLKRIYSKHHADHYADADPETARRWGWDSFDRWKAEGCPLGWGGLAFLTVDELDTMATHAQAVGRIGPGKLGDTPEHRAKTLGRTLHLGPR